MIYPERHLVNTAFIIILVLLGFRFQTGRSKDSDDSLKGCRLVAQV